MMKQLPKRMELLLREMRRFGATPYWGRPKAPREDLSLLFQGWYADSPEKRADEVKRLIRRAASDKKNGVRFCTPRPSWEWDTFSLGTVIVLRLMEEVDRTTNDQWVDQTTLNKRVNDGLREGLCADPVWSAGQLTGLTDLLRVWDPWKRRAKALDKAIKKVAHQSEYFDGDRYIMTDREVEVMLGGTVIARYTPKQYGACLTSHRTWEVNHYEGWNEFLHSSIWPEFRCIGDPIVTYEEVW